MGPEMEMPIMIVSGGRIRMETKSIKQGKEASTQEFIEWWEREGVHARLVGGKLTVDSTQRKWVRPIDEPKDH